ncbi:hypothetical protein WA026_002385 [Henosepilachna vigintioctopunctata]
MLGNFMEDIGITPSQFEHACNKGHDRHSLRFDQNIFEQIWAANNYEMFKRMMTQRNVELQLQALELIEQKYGIMPQSFIPTKKAHAVVERIPQKNEEQLDVKENIEKVVLEEVSKKFPEGEPSNAPEIQFLLEEKEILESTRDKIQSVSVETEKDVIPLENNKNNKHDHGDLNSIEEYQKIPTNNLQKDEISTVIPSGIEKTIDKLSSIKKIDELELKKRQEYLKKQRDKLVALKKEERRKQFGKAEVESVAKKIRPKSAKAAEAILIGEQSAIPHQQLQLRKALAERLKVEVVDKNKE